MKTIYFHLPLLDWATVKKVTIGKDVRQRVPLCTINGNVDLYSHYENTEGNSKSNYHRKHSEISSEYISRGNEIIICTPGGDT